MAGLSLADLVSNFLRSSECHQRFRSEVAVERIDLEKFSIFIPPGDISVGRYVRTASYEPNVVAVLERHLKPGMTIVDVGANLGYLTLISAKRVGDRGRVYAIEANPRNARLLLASLRLNAFDHVRLIPVAAGREPGVLSLSEDFSNGFTTAPSCDPSALLASSLVPCVPLDAVIPRDREIDFVKIDIEGAEMNAVLGFRETIARDKPTIISEFCPAALRAVSDCSGADYLSYPG
jgi:FkbM family methyltransferase